MAKIEVGSKIDYTINKEGNGVYFMVVEGKLTISEYQLKQRDALGVWDTSIVSVEAMKESTILAIEVPMAF
jgi:redox-sensitive bicupin YhaK (pirin superfamily)